MTKSQFRLLYFSYLSKPSFDRPVYRAIQKQRARRILELGVGIGLRARRMIEVAAMFTPVGNVHYAGVDLFEARTVAHGRGVTLKTAHRLLSATGARVRLLPGDPFTALSRAANRLEGTDLVVVSAHQDPDSLARAWLYFPRMLGSGSLVLIEETKPSGNGLVLRPVRAAEIADLAAAALMRRAA